MLTFNAGSGRSELINGNNIENSDSGVSLEAECRIYCGGGVRVPGGLPRLSPPPWPFTTSLRDSDSHSYTSPSRQPTFNTDRLMNQTMIANEMHYRTTLLHNSYRNGLHAGFWHDKPNSPTKNSTSWPVPQRNSILQSPYCVWLSPLQHLFFFALVTISSSSEGLYHIASRNMGYCVGSAARMNLESTHLF
jgi:hypothetical protein